jgi:tRNA(fMet)-specific endonuclease VapC
MKIAIDTSRYSDAVRGDSRVVEILRTAERILVPLPVLAELRYGFLYGSKPPENERRLLRFINSPRVEVLLPDEQTAHEYARVALQLRRQGSPIPINDVWIAALVIQHGLTLYARDKHFDHLPQLARI